MGTPSKKLPVTVLSGFLGSGKTTLLKRLLTQREGLKLAVLVNDMSEINIDAQFIKSGTSLLRSEEKLVELQNGCICCTLRDDLIREVAALAKQQAFDYLIIESTGISEPMAVAESWSIPLPAETYENLSKLSDVAQLDTLVTVVDVKNFTNFISSAEQLSEIYNDVPENDERSIAHLLVDQIECANVILLNKVDLVDADVLGTIRSTVKRLNPSAKLFETNYSDVAFKEIINTNLFDEEKVSLMAGWLQDLQKAPETEEYGISSVVYRRRRPFHSHRFHTFMDEHMEQFKTSIVRVKGFTWFNTKHDTVVEWNGAGTVQQLQPGGYWLASCPQQDFPTDDDKLQEYASLFDPHPLIGDRRQEIVFIGTKADFNALQQRLDECLLTDEEFKHGPGAWRASEDSCFDEGCDEHDHKHDNDDDGHKRGEAEGEEADAGEALTNACNLLESGDHDAALALFANLRNMIEYNMACCHAQKGNYEEAASLLTDSLEHGFTDLEAIAEEADFANWKELDPSDKNSLQTMLRDLGAPAELFGGLETKTERKRKRSPDPE